MYPPSRKLVSSEILLIRLACVQILCCRSEVWIRTMSPSVTHFSKIDDGKSLYRCQVMIVLWAEGCQSFVQEAVSHKFEVCLWSAGTLVGFKKVASHCTYRIHEWRRTMCLAVRLKIPLEVWLAEQHVDRMNPCKVEVEKVQDEYLAWTNFRPWSIDFI